MEVAGRIVQLEVMTMTKQELLRQDGLKPSFPR